VRRLAICLVGFAALLTGPNDVAFAHGRSVSYSSWTIDGHQATVTLRLTTLELSRLAPTPQASRPLDPALARYFVERLQLAASGVACEPLGQPRSLGAPSGKAAFEWRIDCGEREPSEIRSRLLLDVAPSHLHFARLHRPGSGLIERVLSGLETSWQLGAEHESDSASIGSSFGAYLALGVEHIATGYDHLVFLLVLLLMASRLGELATIVTGFTVAHSMTLALAVLGGLRPESNSVEALIGLSIALVAAENTWLLAGRPRVVPLGVAACLLLMAVLNSFGIGSLHPAIPAGLCVFALCYFAILGRTERPVRLRIAISFVFGLVHGFGFAGVLEEIELPVDRLARALLGFNLGVEAGQLVVVAILWPALRWLAWFRGGRIHRWLLELGSAAAGGVGIYWLVERAF
jgi:hypothetical protein